MGASVELRLLGPVELIGPDGPVRLGGPHRRAIVALLALRAGQTVTTDEIVEGLWADAPPANARKSLSTQVAQLRRALQVVGGRLEHTGGGYQLDLPPGHLDLQRFEQEERAASELAAAGNPSRAIERLRAGLACWHGPPLADLVRFPFATTAATWLNPRHHAAQDRLAELLLGAGEIDEAILLLERLVEDDPSDERRWAQLVRALSAGGRRRDALLAYQRAREQLGEGLGLDPGRELRAVERDVLAGAASGPPTMASRPDPGPLIGRAVELDRLDHALERLDHGALQVMAVLGEPGIGKTRLLVEVVHRARARGMTALMGGCEPSQSVPLQALLAALDPLLADPVAPGATRIDPDLPRLLEGPPASPSPIDPTGLDLRRFRIIRALSRTLANLADPGPLVLVLDDVHWLDPLTTAVLDHVCEAEAGRPVLVVLGASTTPVSWATVEERLVRFERSVPLERLRLRPLSAAELQALVRAHAIGIDDVGSLAEQIHEASGGNALYATQLARAAAPTGRLPTSVPDGLDAMCRSRVAVLAPGSRELLDAASVLGPEVEPQLLAAMLDRSTDDVERELHELVAAGLVTEPDADHHRFTHGVVRQVVYDDLTAGRRRRLHGRAADALEASAPMDDPAVVASLAHHLRNARPLVDDDRVRAALEAAAQQATHRGALEEGRRLLEEALDLATTEVERAATELAIGIVGLAAGDRAAARQITAAAAVARAHDRWDLVADAAITQAPLQSSPSPARSRALAAELGEILRHLDDDDLTRRALLQSWRAYLLVNVDPEESRAAVEVAEALAPEAPTRPQIAVAAKYVRLRQAESRGEDPTALVREALALATDTVLAGEPGLASYGHVACQAARVRAGLYDDCREDQDRYLQHAVDTHQRAIELQLVAVDVALRYATGTVDEAEAASLALFERLTAAEVESAQQVRFVQQLFTARERGATRGWVELLTQVAARPLAGTEPVIAAGLVPVDDVGAQRVIEPFLAGLGGLPRDWSHDALVALAADVVSDLRLAGPHVEQLYDALLPVQGQVVTLTSVVMVLGRADRYLGRLAHLAGDTERALQHLATARRLDDAAGSGLWAGWAARDEALVRLQRLAAGDREVAADLLDLARARARRHGSARLAHAASV